MQLLKWILKWSNLKLCKLMEIIQTDTYVELMFRRFWFSLLFRLWISVSIPRCGVCTYVRPVLMKGSSYSAYYANKSIDSTITQIVSGRRGGGVCKQQRRLPTHEQICKTLRFSGKTALGYGYRSFFTIISHRPFQLIRLPVNKTEIFQYKVLFDTLVNYISHAATFFIFLFIRWRNRKSGFRKPH